VTVNVALPDTEPDLAVTTVEPTATVWASPEPELTVPTDGLADDQLTLLVKSAVVLSEYVPVALNCWVSPAGTLGALGITAMECKVTGGGAAGVDEPPPQASSPRNRISAKVYLMQDKIGRY
jgi:hypothetical protein